MMPDEEPQKLHLTLITGLSGAGKSEAVATLEDAGYFCIDNLPPRMLPNVLDLFALEGNRTSRVALVFDARGGTYFEELGESLEYLRASNIPFRLLYLEADDDELVARYQVSRRPHPLSRKLLEGIERERQLLAPLRASADIVIDTTRLSPWRFRRRLEEVLLADRLSDEILVSIESFGYRFGLPGEADMVLDARFLPNPHWVPELRPLSGLDDPVREFVANSADAQGFLQQIVDLIRFLAPRFVAEQKRRLVLAVGCTGGRHRSVVLAEELARHMEEDPRLLVSVSHRDIERGERR
jgi:UPF0042 nucleotide-binding protein